MPAEYGIFGAQWAELNPSWEVKTWGIEALLEFPELDPVFDDLYRRDDGRFGIELYVQLADVIGYALVEKFGGAYFNCDMQPVRPLGMLPHLAWASLENNEDGRIVNAAIGAQEPHNPFWRAVLERLPRRYFANPTAEMVETTGPVLLTDVAHEFPSLLHVFGTRSFNPVHWKQIADGGDASPWLDQLPVETIAVHHWGHRKFSRTNYVEDATQ